METDQKQSVSKNPVHLDTLSVEELTDELIELEDCIKRLENERDAILAELDERMEYGEPYDHVVKVDGPDRLGMTVRVQKIRGARRWSYNAKGVLDRLKDKPYAEPFIKPALSKGLFNAALNKEGQVYEDFGDIVQWVKDDDRIDYKKGLKEVLKHRGLKE